MPPKQDLSGGSFPAGLQKGDLMFAKLFGFPWWPSVVRSVRHAYNEEQPLVRVRFCHTDDNATLRPKELIRFVDRDGSGMQSSVKVGPQAGVGVDVALTRSIGLDFELDYAHYLWESAAGGPRGIVQTHLGLLIYL